MNTSKLPYIIAIASTGSLSAAARQLGVTQPALSKYLKNTEREIGQELFFRSQNRYVPTPAGQIFIATAQQILSVSHNTRTAIAALKSEGQPPLRLGISPNRGMNTLVAVYPEFDQHFPEVQIVTHEGFAAASLEKLLAGKLDFILTSHAAATPDRVRIIPTQKEELVLAVPAFHPTVKHNTFLLSELPYADLRDYRDCTFTIPGPQTTMHSLILELFKTSGITPQVTAMTPNLLMQEAMIRSGTKVGILPAYYVRPNPDIAYFRLQNSPMLPCCCMLRKDTPITPAVEYLIFLFFRHSLHAPNAIPIWTDFTSGLIRKYDPLEAAAYGLEKTI